MPYAAPTYTVENKLQKRIQNRKGRTSVALALGVAHDQQSRANRTLIEHHE